MAAELLLDARALLGEGPVWDARVGVLHWVDIEGFAVHTFTPATGRDRVVPVGEHVGCVAPRARGGLVVALRRGLGVLDPVTGALEHRSVPPGHLPEVRFNDGRTDPEGRLWAGTIELTSRPGAAALWRLDPDWSLHRMIDGVTISNGLAWSRDASTLYYIDTPTRSVAAFDFDRATGVIANRRVVIRVPEDMGWPDGMTIDAADTLWIAQWDGGCVGAWDPLTGRLLERIELPARRVTSCAFGGSALDELFVTTARTGLDESALASQPLSGGLFRVRPGAVGLPSVEFAG
jgi:sugar lactone lactonase YvrE